MTAEFYIALVCTLLVLIATALVLYRFRFVLMSPLRFEKYVMRLYERDGYKCELTKKSNDQGVDIIARKLFKSVAVQIKKYRGSVSNSAVQEVVAGKKYYRLHSATVVTCGRFTRSARELAKANGVKLVDMAELKKIIHGKAKF